MEADKSLARLETVKYLVKATEDEFQLKEIEELAKSHGKAIHDRKAKEHRC